MIEHLNPLHAMIVGGTVAIVLAALLCALDNYLPPINPV